MTQMQTMRIQGPDGELSVRTWGRPQCPTVVLVHGYPDDSSKWMPIAQALCDNYRVVAYDVRGAGQSFTPPACRASYTLERLCADFQAVIDQLSPDRAVHLVAHDWGSIQAWHFATEGRLVGRLASFTSVSGPCLDHVGHWMRDRLRRPTPANLWALLQQWIKSWYIYVFHLPLLPERIWRGRLGRSWHHVLRWLEGTHAQPRASQAKDGENGVWLYRANMLARLLAPQTRVAHVPVQVIVPLGDRYVSPRLSADLSRWVPQLWRREVLAQHWMSLKSPQVFARLVREFIDHIELQVPSVALERARVNPPLPSTAGARLPLAGQVCVITGAGSGIGHSAAHAFAQAGATIVAVDINATSAQQTVEELRQIGAKAHARGVDVADEAGMRELVQWVDAQLGGADIVINNAGIGMGGGALATSMQDWRKVIDVNLWGVIHGSSLFAQQMVARARKGHIINTASAAAYGPSRSLAAYATTKAAVLMLSECLRGELAEHGIGVSAICPGFAQTGIMAATHYVGVGEQEQAHLRQRAQRLYEMRGLQPKTVALAMVEAVRHNRAVVSVGVEAHGTRWLYRLAPGLSRRLARLDLLAR